MITVLKLRCEENKPNQIVTIHMQQITTLLFDYLWNQLPLARLDLRQIN